MKKLILLLIIIFNFSCNYTDNVINPITQNPVDVYLAGQKNGHACYWKNNQEYVLDDIGLFDSKATKIIIFSNDVHIWAVRQMELRSILKIM